MNKRGFTLVEVLVVIAIITIISGVMVVNFRQSEQGSKLQRSAQQTIQGIRKAQNMALSSMEHEGQVYDYYGVYFDKQNMPNSYHIFASDNKVYNAGEEIETISLESGMVIDSISTGNQLNLTFLPPYAFVEFNPSITQATITIKNEGGSCPQDCKYIKVNDKGWMSIKNIP